MNHAFTAHRTLCVLALLVLLAALAPFAPVQPALAQDSVPTDTEEAAAAAASPQAAMLKDIYTANASSDPTFISSFGNQFFFSAVDAEHGRELWISNGTLAGTSLVKDLTPGADGSSISNATPFNEKLFFVNGRSLYSTTGTAAQTELVYESGWDENYAFMNHLEAAGDWLYIFFDNGSVKRYNAVTGDMQPALDASIRTDTINAAVMDGAVYFNGHDSGSGNELWRLDVTTGSAVLVKDICPGTCDTSIFAEPGSNPQSLTAVNGKLFFTAWDETHGQELWVSDGSEGGTALARDIYTGSASGSPLSLMAAGTWLYFTANDGGAHGRELWRSGGTTANTTLVADIAAGAPSSILEYGAEMAYLAAGSQVFFTARNAAAGLELWSVPITAAGMPATPRLLEIAPGAASSFPTHPTAMGSAVYFSAQASPGNYELWKSGGQPASTALVADIVPGADGSNPFVASAWNGKLVLTALDAAHGRELWTSNGTTGGTALLVDLRTGPDETGSLGTEWSSENGIMTNVGGNSIRYFTARDALHGVELWRTDGTSAGTWMVKDINPGPEGGLEFTNDNAMAEMGGILYFAAHDPDHGERVWRTNGTPSGTWMVKDIEPGNRYGYPVLFTVAGDKLFFRFSADNGTYQLWVTDGTSGGTRPLKDFPQIDFQPFSIDLAGAGSTLIFDVNDIENSTTELWRSDGTPDGTEPFFGPFPFDATLHYDSSINWMQGVGEKVYISMNNMDIPGGEMDGSNDRLWVTDGTTEGTHIIGPQTEPFPYLPDEPVQVGSDLFFTARVTTGGFHGILSLWKLPAASTTPSLEKELGSFEPRFLTSLDGANLLLLLKSKYDDDVYWKTINIQTKSMNTICISCYPLHTVTPASALGKVYFLNSEPYSTTELWETDGTQAGTVKVPLPEGVRVLVSDGSFLGTPQVFYFVARDADHGYEPWVLNADYDFNYPLYIPLISRR